MMDRVEVKTFLLRHIDSEEVTGSVREIKNDPGLVNVPDQLGHLGAVLTDPDIVFLSL